jgi:dTDP-4-amino-4,6-dideoxygalactose transaminase
VTPWVANYAEPVWHLYVIRVPDRDMLRSRLEELGIATGIHYPVPVHLQPAYRDLGYRMGDFPITERFAEEVLSLPMYAELSRKAIGAVCEAIREFAVEHVVESLVAQPVSVTALDD